MRWLHHWGTLPPHFCSPLPWQSCPQHTLPLLIPLHSSSRTGHTESVTSWPLGIHPTGQQHMPASTLGTVWSSWRPRAHPTVGGCGDQRPCALAGRVCPIVVSSHLSCLLPADVGQDRYHHSSCISFLFSPSVLQDLGKNRYLPLKSQ